MDAITRTGRPKARPKAAADYLGLTMGTLAKKRMRGEGPRYSKVNRTLILYDLDDCDAWVDAHKQQSTSEAA